MTMSDVLEARRNAILSAIEILRSKKIVSMESIDNQRREKGSGGLRYREERKIWEASIDLGIDSNGKRIRKVRTGKTKEIAFKNLETAVMDHYSKLEETLHKELLEIESQIEKEKINKNGILLSEFYKEFVNQKSVVM